MYIILSVIYILFIFEQVFGGHFDEDTIRWIPMTKNATTSPVPAMIIQTLYIYILYHKLNVLSQISWIFTMHMDLILVYGIH